MRWYRLPILGPVWEGEPKKRQSSRVEDLHNQSHTFIFWTILPWKGCQQIAVLLGPCYAQDADEKVQSLIKAEGRKKQRHLELQRLSATKMSHVATFGNSCLGLDMNDFLVVWFQMEPICNFKFAARLLCGHHEMTGCFNYATTNSTCSRNFWNRCIRLHPCRMCDVVWHMNMLEKSI